MTVMVAPAASVILPSASRSKLATVIVANSMSSSSKTVAFLLAAAKLSAPSFTVPASAIVMASSAVKLVAPSMSIESVPLSARLMDPRLAPLAWAVMLLAPVTLIVAPATSVISPSASRSRLATLMVLSDMSSSSKTVAFLVVALRLKSPSVTVPASAIVIASSASKLAAPSISKVSVPLSAKLIDPALPPFTLAVMLAAPVTVIVAPVASVMLPSASRSRLTTEMVFRSMSASSNTVAFFVVAVKFKVPRSTVPASAIVMASSETKVDVPPMSSVSPALSAKLIEPPLPALVVMLLVVPISTSVSDASVKLPLTVRVRVPA